MIELRRRYSGGVQSPSFSRLPADYQEVEYLDNSENSSAYLIIPKIKNGFIGTITGKIAVSSEKVQSPNFPYKIAFGWADGPQVGIAVKNGIMYWHNFVSSNSSVEINRLYNVILEISGSTSNLFVDDVLLAINTTFSNNDVLYIFNVGNKSISWFGKIYRIKIAGTENVDLIPCYRKADNIAGMYDLVSGEFYTNAGTGTFDVGPLVI